MQILSEQLNDMEIGSVDAKTVIAEALTNLGSSQLITANGAIVSLHALAQDTVNQKLMSESAHRILTAIAAKFAEIAHNHGEASDREEFASQASNFLLKFVPQLSVASKIDTPVLDNFTRSLLTILSTGENNNVRLIP